MDSSIKFVGIVNKMGSVVASAFQNEASNLTHNELKNYAIKAVLRMMTRNEEPKLGRPIYTFTLYERAKRVSIPLEHMDYVLLIASLDRSADHNEIVLDKILPMIKRQKLFAAET